MLPFAGLVVVPVPLGALGALGLTPTYSGAPTFAGTITGRTPGSTLTVTSSSGGTWSVSGSTLNGSSLSGNSDYTVQIRETYGTATRFSTVSAHVDTVLNASAYNPSSDRSAVNVYGGSGSILYYQWSGTRIDGSGFATPTNQGNPSTGWIGSGQYHVGCTVADADGQVVGSNQVTVVVP